MNLPEKFLKYKYFSIHMNFYVSMKILNDNQSELQTLQK